MQCLKSKIWSIKNRQVYELYIGLKLCDSVLSYEAIAPRDQEQALAYIASLFQVIWGRFSPKLWG